MGGQADSKQSDENLQLNLVIASDYELGVHEIYHRATTQTKTFLSYMNYDKKNYKDLLSYYQNSRINDNAESYGKLQGILNILLDDQQGNKF